MKRIKSIRELVKLREIILKERKRRERLIVVSTHATCCHLKGSKEVASAFEEEIKRRKLGKEIRLLFTGCLGFCEVEPVVLIQPEGIFYPSVTPEAVPEILWQTGKKGEILRNLVYKDPERKEEIPFEKDIPFYKRQMRLVLGDNGKIDPTKIEDYIAIGGYSALTQVLKEMTSEEVIAEIKASGLRGRGGAGFPTGIKWELTRKEKSDMKYVICNADEGDPGAYMDRSILESNPHLVIEGMIIGGWAIGASEGWIYVRNEYPLAIEHLTKAIAQAEDFGFLGKNIFGSGFDFSIKISKGAGAFVCGEETALIASIEGRRGIPRQRPPFPAVSGLWGKPTNINNVETWANVPKIILNGAEWFNKIGTETSKGTKIFSLVGKVKNTGLVEVPMGITLKEVVFAIGGGARNGKKIKAVQTGGPSGGCIPEELFNLPVDYESLSKVGSIMGSGGMIVMDEDTCMVDVAQYFTNFLQDESCGKCSTCREGTQQMYFILKDIIEGNGSEKDLALLAELGSAVKDASMCGLGQTAPNPLLSTLRYFRSEYLAHIKEKKCPAGVCKALIRFEIIAKKCTGCALCFKNCPVGAIKGEPKKVHTIIKEKCIKCGICYDVCKFGAVLKASGEKDAKSKN